MDLSTIEKTKLLKTHLEKIDIFSAEIGLQIQNIMNKHRAEGGHVEYAYVTHFHREIIGLSRLMQYLLKDDGNKIYTFFAVRASIETLLYLEFVLQLAQEDPNKVLKLLSVDMAQTAASINAAAPADKSNPIHHTLEKINFVNKILKTGFSLETIKSNTPVFPNIRELCNHSSLNIKDLYGSDIYHLYRLYSESNHLRLSSMHSITDENNLITYWALEYFVEIYIKFYELILNTKIFSDDYTRKLDSIKELSGP